MIDLMPRLNEACMLVEYAGDVPTTSFVFVKEMEDLKRSDSASSDTSCSDISSIYEKKKESAFMDVYMQQLTTLKLAISAVTKANEQFAQQTQLVKTNVTQEDEAEIRETINSITATQSETLKMIHAVIKGLTNENEIFGQQNPNAAELRIRENLLGAVTRKFKQVVNEYQTMQDLYRQENKKRIMRQLDIIHSANMAEEEDLTQMAMTHGIGHVIDALLRGGSSALYGGLADVEDKYKDVKALEQNIIELHGMFEQLATMVDLNGEMLDNIECHVQGAEDHMERGNAQLEKAKKQKMRSKKMASWIAAGIGLVIAIILLIIFL